MVGNGTRRSVMAAVLAGAAGMAGMALLPGCQQYSTYPEIPTAHGMPENPNNPSAATCMRLAVQYVCTRWAPGGPNFEAQTAEEQGSLKVQTPIVLNLPQGMRRTFYERVVSEVGPGARAMSTETENSGDPVIHVTRVWMRFNRATVDVLRPMPEIGPGADGKPVYQLITVRLEGGMEPWHVVHARAFEPGWAQLPAPNFLPEEDRFHEAKFSTATQTDDGTGEH